MEQAHAPAPGSVLLTEQPRELTLEFHGSPREYFRLWTVNLCLTLLTLGVFSAWAKVRKKRYLYAHTALDGTPFQYLGQPIPILKGRVVAVILFVVYWTSSHLFTHTLPYVLAAGLLLAPWVIVRSAAFTARYSAFRNLRFDFHGGYLQAMTTLYAFGLIPALVIGTLFGWWGNPMLAVAAYAIFGLAFPWWIRRVKHFIVTHTRFGGENGELTVTGTQFFKMYFVAGLIIVAASIATGLALAGVFRSMKASEYAFLLASLPGYAGYVLAFAYVQAHGTNLVWNHAALGPLRFKSTLTGRAMAKLYFTNALGILLSLGLLTPWAVMRTFKYRADNTRVFLEGELSAFHGADADAVRAAGAEVGEFFDVDLSL